MLRKKQPTTRGRGQNPISARMALANRGLPANTTG